ncbi:MAG: bifunctional diguanylate cyclase/phosphodiesterase [Gammaproteobacteria bacterium]
MRIYRYRWQEIFEMSLLAGVYFALAVLVLQQFSETGNVTLIWFSGGLGLAVLLIRGLHYWPGIFIGALAAGLIVDDALWISAIIAVGNTLESVIAAWWLNRDAKFSVALNRPWHFFRLTYVAFCCSLISAALGPAALWWGGLIPTSLLSQSIAHWWMADVFGIIFTTPVFMIWRRWPHEWFRPRRMLGTLLFIGSCFFFGQLAFSDTFPLLFGRVLNGYWLYLCVIWGALRFGRHGVMLVSSIVVVMGLFGAAHHEGMFADDYRQTAMLNFWLYTSILAWTGTLLVLTLQSNLSYAQVLKVSQSRLQAIIDASPIPIAVNNDKQIVTMLNPAFVKTFGYTRNDIPTLNEWWNKAFPDREYRQAVISNWRQEIEKVKQSGRSFQAFEQIIECKNGECRHVMVGSVALQGMFENEYLVTLQDLTDQIKANKALSDSNILLQTILETLPLRVFWKDRTSHYLGGNHLFARDAGLETVEELLNKTDDELGWWEQAAAYQANDKRVIETGQAIVNSEEPRSAPNGQTSWLRFSKLPLRNSEKKIIGVLGVYEDISMRKRIDDQLLWRTTFLETLLEATPDGIVAVDVVGNKLLQNQRLVDLWRIPPEIAEQTDDKIQLEFVKNQTVNPERFLEKVAYLYAHPDETSTDEVELKNGVMLLRFTSPIRDRSGHNYGRLWYFSDVTETRKAERSLRQKEYYQRSLIDNFPFQVWLKDKDSRYLAVNKTFAQHCHVDIRHIIGKTDFDLFSSEIADVHRCEDQIVMSSGQRQTVEKEVEFDGRKAWFETYCAPLTDDTGAISGTVGFSRDITERKEAEDALKLAALVFDNSSEAMIVTDADNKILMINAAFTQVTGYTLDEVVGKYPKILASGRHDKSFYQTMWASLNATGSWRGEIENRRKDGSLYIEEIVINTIFDSEGRVRQRVALFSDITERKRTEEQVWQQANFDSLTGLPNRRLMRERLAQEMKKARRMNQRLGLLFIDLDHFKEVNDALGHEMGDELLKDAARRLAACVRESDTVARLGGDEFTIILSDLDSCDSPERVASELGQRFSEPFVLNGELVYVSASIGITLYPDDSTDLSQLLRNADQAMYAAKGRGRNCYSFFTLSMQESMNARALMISDLRGALANQQFKLVYQPIVNLVSGDIDKAEALLRWQHPVRGLVSPIEFIPLAEESGLIYDIGNWVFETAARQVVKWRQEVHADFQISINKSPQQFLDSRHRVQDWIECLKQLNLPGAAVVVEITESLLLEANSKTREQLLAFRDAGMQVAIDDFGTGYSSLAYLKKFDIDYLKIDRSFIRNLGADSNDFVLCEAIIVMAHKLGLKVVAEGVETEQQRALLKSVGCDYAQGYLFARPMSPEEFERDFPAKDNGSSRRSGDSF